LMRYLPNLTINRTAVSLPVDIFSDIFLPVN
jgi:hypothetical protein